MEEEFISCSSYHIKNHQVSSVCSSNIALIKYWGKYKNQIPANPSISYTLDRCRTQTNIEFTKGAPFSVKVFLSGKREVSFSEKIEKYFRGVSRYLPWVEEGRYVITTENTFPHSSGIASSASGFGAIAKCLVQLDTSFGQPQEPAFETKKASFLARLGSGSACRSLYKGLVVWGKTEGLAGSSDLYAVVYPPDKVHPVFKNFNDWVLLIHKGQKMVSSTLGHSLMENHPYAEIRFTQACKNFSDLQKILLEGDIKEFIRLVEHEALTLHALMMMSRPAFILMKRGTLEVIERIWSFRKETGLDLFFTLDAGANVHLLFPEGPETEKIKSFIVSELLAYSQDHTLIKDEINF
ncbi:MAG: diphosphomevalonate decarboxylase [Bergeyella sp.]|nr:diphosphomevalonate decarboxylase [Bergeyella sp.]